MSQREITPRSWRVRLAGGVRRRAKHVWDCWTSNDSARPVPRTLQWLTQQAAAGAGLPELGGGAEPSLSAAALALPTLAACGLREPTQRLMAWLLNQQSEQGGFCNASGSPCRLTTATVLRSLLMLLDESPPSDGRIAAAAESAAAWLARQADQSEGREPPGSLLNWTSPATRLIPLAAQFRASVMFHQPLWQRCAIEAAQRLRRAHDLARWNMPTHVQGEVAQALLDLGWRDDASRLMAQFAALQRTKGDVPALASVRWVSSAGLARLAQCWCELGETARADAALAALYRRQMPDGGIAGSWGPGAAYHPLRQTTSAACLAIQASLAQVAASFAQYDAEAGDPLLPGDGRLRAVTEFVATLPPGSRIADIGCGTGRYLSRLCAAYPRHTWTGIDICPRAVAQLPAGVAAVRGSLLNLPLPDAALDAVYCVEALEHALLPEQAIRELARVVRPGGRLLVIDKHRRAQALSEHQPWEQWFEPDEVCDWLRAHCDEVYSAAVAHGPQRTSSVFVAWTARRKAAALERAA